MKKYTMSFAAASTHTPQHPERTARRCTHGFDVTFQVWTNRMAMARSIRMQEKREGRPGDWRACVPLEATEGY